VLPGPARRLARLLVLVALLCACVPAVAQATTYTVDRSDDDATANQCTGADNDCSLRGALTDVESTPDTTDTIVVPALTVTLGTDGELPEVADSSIDLTISGAGARSSTIDADHQGRILQVATGSVSFQGLTLTNGTTTGDGGALLDNGPDAAIDVQDSAITNSHADGVGGGISNANGTLTVARSLFTGDSVLDDGAAIDVDGGTATITNTTVTGNDGPYTVDSDTGVGSGTVLSFVTLALNTDTSTGCSDCNAFFFADDTNSGGAAHGSADNTMIVGNPENGSDECSEPIANASHVLDDDGTCVGGSPDNGSATITDPKLGGLADNGGPTDTLGLLPGSPAIDAADSGACPGTDQRGFTRPVGGGCDVGAFEGVLTAAASSPGAPSLPLVSDVSPTSGPAGTFVGITGRNFDSATQVLLGGVPTSFSIDGYGHITTVAPAGGTGAVDIQVVNPAGKSVTSPTDVFTYASTAGPTTSGGQGAPAVKQVCVMPNLHRHSYRYSKKLLAAAGCVGPLTHKGHAKHPPSHVKRQSPAAGAPLFAGGTISLKLG
jgi:hypothetical protein